MWRPPKNRRHGRGHVLNVKVRSDQARGTRVRLATAAFSLVFGTLFGLYLFWRAGEWALDKFVYENAEFAIQHIDVQTNGKIPIEQLRRWAGVNSGQNLIVLDLAAVKRNLELVSAIKSVSVERVLPGTLRIRVTERDAIAQVNVPRADPQNGIAISVFQLDANGFVMQPMDPRLRVVPLAQMNAPLPVLTGLNIFQLQPGHRLDSPQALAALNLVTAFQHSPMAGLAELQRIDVSSPNVVVVTTIQGSEITFSLDNLQQQLARWREIYDLGRRMNKSIASADLAVANNVPVHWTDMISAPDAAPENSNTQNLRRKNV
ncbi:MAG TPA: FtsQ-type POTRA domain-containing protein [Candidatus Acidoferrum sp.]|nr:FtsQ-type POTRA domain-containing protein [Candidatus Acidoferrum sp.]